MTQFCNKCINGVVETNGIFTKCECVLRSEKESLYIKYGIPLKYIGCSLSDLTLSNEEVVRLVLAAKENKLSRSIFLTNKGLEKTKFFTYYLELQLSKEQGVRYIFFYDLFNNTKGLTLLRNLDTLVIDEIALVNKNMGHSVLRELLLIRFTNEKKTLLGSEFSMKEISGFFNIDLASFEFEEFAL